MENWNINLEEFYGQNTNEEKIRFLLRFAILAPSTHNTQPWLFKIQDSSCLIYSNPKFRLPLGDKDGRDFYISFGCCIENLVTASQYFNVFKSVNYKLKGNLVAQVEFKNLNASVKAQPSLKEKTKAISKRVTARGVFDNKKIPKNIITSLKKLPQFKDLELTLIENPEKIEQLANLTAQGLRIAYKNPKFRNEMSHWINTNFSKRLEGIPGYALRLPNLVSLLFPTLVKYKDLGGAVSKINFACLNSAPLIGIISAKKDSQENWLNTGRLAESAMLELYKNNVKTSIFVASVEMQDLYKQVQGLINTTSRPQFLFCAGYMKFNQKHTLRHPLESKIIS